MTTPYSTDQMTSGPASDLYIQQAQEYGQHDQSVGEGECSVDINFQWILSNFKLEHNRDGNSQGVPID